MLRCLELAALGRWQVRGNPMVGALLVARGQVIGEGYHRAWGQPHAEIEALNAVKPEQRGWIREATLYVNLEPCSHHGKTPPCSERIVREGIPRVVVGMTDPNPNVAGRGLAMLREAGCAITTHVMEAECRLLNQAFLCRMEKKRPWVLLKWAQSADGFLTAANSGTIRLTGAWSDRLVHEWRAQFGAILVGARTVLQDNPQLRARPAFAGSMPQHALPLVQPIVQPIRIVLDRYGQLPQEARVFDGQAPTLVVRSPDLPPDRYLLPKAEVMAIQYDGKLLPKLLGALAEREINSVLVEGGAATLNAFIQTNLWDEIRIFKSEISIGPGASNGAVKAPAPPGQWLETLSIGNDTLERRIPGQAPSA
jgi:diaminohydroxyphosphoribosylaminopyrimidine deaminase/5-amino-6-(5-phosphoribosylamino)uracil reductase